MARRPNPAIGPKHFLIEPYRARTLLQTIRTIMDEASSSRPDGPVGLLQLEEDGHNDVGINRDTRNHRGMKFPGSHCIEGRTIQLRIT